MCSLQKIVSLATDAETNFACKLKPSLDLGAHNVYHNFKRLAEGENSTEKLYISPVAQFTYPRSLTAWEGHHKL